MDTNNPIDRHIAEEVRESKGNISLVSRKLGINFDYLKSLSERDEPVSSFRITYEPFPEDIRALAKPGMEKFVVAVKKRGLDWPKRFEDAIKDARRKYDAGSHEMVTGHTRGFAVLYLLPLRRSVEPRHYFRSFHLV
jgi:hypothetical protein